MKALRQRGMTRAEAHALRERSIARVTNACGPLFEHAMAKPDAPLWVGEMGPLNKWERDLAREVVVSQVVYEVEMAARFSQFRRMC